MDYEHYILQGEAKSTEFSDDRSYLLVQKANSYCACVGQTEECCLPKIDLIDDFGSLLYSCLDRCALGTMISKGKQEAMNAGGYDRPAVHQRQEHRVLTSV